MGLLTILVWFESGFYNFLLKVIVLPMLYVTERTLYDLL